MTSFRLDRPYKTRHSLHIFNRKLKKDYWKILADYVHRDRTEDVRNVSRRGSLDSHAGSDHSEKSRRDSGKSRREDSVKSRLDSSEKRKRRMSYVPPRLRQKTPAANGRNGRNKSDSDDDKKGMSKQQASALSKRSVRNFDDKKYKSNSHLTPVDW